MKRVPLLPIFLIVLVDVLGLTLLVPLLPFYAQHLGASVIEVGLLLTTYAACALVSGPLLGRLSDRTGRKPLLLVSQLGTFISLLVLAWADVLWVAFLARAVDGLTAGNLSLAQAYISDVTQPEKRAKAFGMVGVAFGLGFLVGPAVSGWLAQYGHTYPILLAAALSLTSIVATATLLPRAPPVEPDTGALPAGRRLALLDWGTYLAYFRRPELGRVLWQFFCFSLSFGTFTSGVALFAERRLTYGGEPFGPREVGYVFAYAGLLGIILQGGLIGRLVKRFGERALSTWGFLTGAVGYVLLAGTHDLPMLLLAATVSSLGMGVLRPTLTSLVTQGVGPREQGVALGLTQSLMSVSQIFAPLLAGALIHHGYLGSWALVAALAAATGFGLGRLRPHRPEARAPTS